LNAAVSTGNNNFLGMENSIILISALLLVAMTLASCESIPSAYNPFAPDEMATTLEPSGPPVPGETIKSHP
jgi:hypothetical protein